MVIDILALLCICILATLAWWVLDRLCHVPVLKNVLQVVIVVVAVLLVLQSLGVWGASVVAR